MAGNIFFHIFNRISTVLIAVIVATAFVLKGPQIIELLKTTDSKWAFAGLFFYCFNYYIRSHRLKTISMKNISVFPGCFYVASVHGIATYILPFKTGELALPSILNSAFGIPIREGAQILVRARLLDFEVLGLWMIISILSFQIPVAIPLKILWIIAGVGLALSLRCTEYLSTKFIKRFSFYFRLSNPNRVTEFIQSFLIWSAIGVSLYCTVKAIGLDLSLGAIWFIISIQLPMQIIPLQGIASTGSHEGSWILGLHLLGFSSESALELALASHALILFYVLSLGVISFVVKNLFHDDFRLV